MNKEPLTAIWFLTFPNINYFIPKLAFSHTKIFNTFKCSGNNKKDSYEAPYKAIVSTGCRGQQSLQAGGCLWDGWEGEDEQLNPWLKFIGLNDVLGSSQQSSGLGRGQKGSRRRKESGARDGQ